MKKSAMLATVVLALVAGIFFANPTTVTAATTETVLQVERGSSGNEVFAFVRGAYGFFGDIFRQQSLTGEVFWEMPLTDTFGSAQRITSQAGLEGFIVQYSSRTAFSWVDVRNKVVRTFYVTADGWPQKIVKNGDEFLVATANVLEWYSLAGEYKRSDFPEESRVVFGWYSWYEAPDFQIFLVGVWEGRILTNYSPNEVFGELNLHSRLVVPATWREVNDFSIYGSEGGTSYYLDGRAEFGERIGSLKR